MIAKKMVMTEYETRKQTVMDAIKKIDKELESLYIHVYKQTNTKGGVLYTANDILLATSLALTYSKIKHLKNCLGKILAEKGSTDYFSNTFKNGVKKIIDKLLLKLNAHILLLDCYFEKNFKMVFESNGVRCV